MPIGRQVESSAVAQHCVVHSPSSSPTSLLLGMNKFLRGLEITFRRDSENFRPRINKRNSVKVGG